MAFINFVIGALLFGLAMWGGIKILDRYNSRNSLALAGVIGAVFSLAAPVFGIFMVLPLVALLYLLVSYYDLGLLRSFGVVGIMYGSLIALGLIVQQLTIAFAGV